jgi:hypothetical protein
MKRSFFAAITAIVCVVSCNTTEEENSEAQTSGSSVSVNAPKADTVAPVQTNNQSPLVLTPPPIVMNPSASAPTSPNQAVNPPHGQPGHRCDIAVGAPLSQAGAAPAVAQPPVVQQQPTTPVAPVIKPTVTPAPQPSATVAKGKNPPHGQPGHRCDIAVGAPLPAGNAAPAASATPATPIQINQSAPIVPALQANTAPANKTTSSATPGVKVNPAHGQPGHRCDIAVGAPLQ